ncbi:hypothetical protein [Clostridium algidicarnis]|uniref:hypothetical protein n=1 Tax=Clostridium algidicarnis TaxID=37659 RepID=UPI003FD6DCBC
MSERKEEISFVLDMITKICNEAKIALIPCETKRGVKYVGVLDNTNGKKYAMIRDE